MSENKVKIAYALDTLTKARDFWYVYAVPDEKDEKGMYARACVVNMYVAPLAADTLITPIFHTAEMSAEDIQKGMAKGSDPVNFAIHKDRKGNTKLRLTQGSVRHYPVYSIKNRSTMELKENKRSFTLMLKEEATNVPEKLGSKYYVISPTGEIGILSRAQLFILAASYTITNAYPKQHSIVFKPGTLRSSVALSICYTIKEANATEPSIRAAKLGDASNIKAVKTLDVNTFLGTSRQERVQEQMRKHIGSNVPLYKLSRKELDMVRSLADNMPNMLRLYDKWVLHSSMDTTVTESFSKKYAAYMRILKANYADKEPQEYFERQRNIITLILREGLLSKATNYYLAGNRNTPTMDKQYAEELYTAVKTVQFIDSVYNKTKAAAVEKQVQLERACIFALTWEHIPKETFEVIQRLNEAHKFLTKVVPLRSLTSVYTNIPAEIKTELAKEDTTLYNSLSSPDLTLAEKMQNLRVLQQMSPASSAMYAAVVHIEPFVTQILTNVCQRLGLKMEGLDFRLKLPVSANVKEAERLRMLGQTESERLNSMNDCLRYTVIIDVPKGQPVYPVDMPETVRTFRPRVAGTEVDYYYINMAMEVLREVAFDLTACVPGKPFVPLWEITRMTNYWEVPNRVNPYNGLNCTFSYVCESKKTKQHTMDTRHGGTPFGLLSFEIQMHTQESFNLKNGVLHELYEETRMPGITDEKLAQNNHLSEEYANKLERIPQIEQFTEDRCKSIVRSSIYPWWVTNAEIIKKVSRLNKFLETLSRSKR